MFAFEQKLSTEFVFFSKTAFLPMPSMWGVYMIYITAYDLSAYVIFNIIVLV